MIELHGFALSNYYNKVKIALLEKGVAFEEKMNGADKDEATLALSPLGKIPFMRTDFGPLAESQVQLDYLEDAFPATPLYPADPFARAKNRELIAFLELHVELVARRLYPQAFFGGKVSDTTIADTRVELERNIAAFARLAKFAPFIAGDQFTMADCAAVVHLPLISSATKVIYGQDLLAALPVRDYLKLVGERASVARVNADRKANAQQRAKG